MFAICGLSCLLAGGALPPVACAQEQMAVGASDHDHALLEQVERHLDAISQLKARFRQTAPDGKESTGTAWIDRTNRRMRFQYDPPSPLLLVANHDQSYSTTASLTRPPPCPWTRRPLACCCARACSFQAT